MIPRSLSFTICSVLLIAVTECQKHIPRTRGNFRLSVTLSDYSNPSDKGSNGNRCEGSVWMQAKSDCDPFFEVIFFMPGDNPMRKKTSRRKFANRRHILGKFFAAEFDFGWRVLMSKERTLRLNTAIEVNDHDRAFGNDHIIGKLVNFRLRKDEVKEQPIIGAYARLLATIEVSCQPGYDGDYCQLTKRQYAEQLRAKRITDATTTKPSTTTKKPTTTTKKPTTTTKKPTTTTTTKKPITTTTTTTEPTTTTKKPTTTTTTTTTKKPTKATERKQPTTIKQHPVAQKIKNEVIPHESQHHQFIFIIAVLSTLLIMSLLILVGVVMQRRKCRRRELVERFTTFDMVNDAYEYSEDEDPKPIHPRRSTSFVGVGQRKYSDNDCGYDYKRF